MVVSGVHGHAYPKYLMLKVITDEVLSVQFTVFSGYILYLTFNFMRALLFIVCWSDKDCLPVFRPRPDFLSRCYPEGPPDHVTIKDTLACYGNEELILEGLKSFPSGHTSCECVSICLW